MLYSYDNTLYCNENEWTAVLHKNLTISNNVKQKKRVTKECIPYGIKFKNRQN